MNTPAPALADLAARLLEHAAVHDAETSPYSPEQAQWADDLRAAAALLSSPAPAQAAPSAVPEGYAVVPVEPTPEMVAADLAANHTYWKEMDEGPAPIGKWRNGTPSEATAESYAAMLAAAPAPAAPVVAAPGFHQPAPAGWVPCSDPPLASPAWHMYTTSQGQADYWRVDCRMRVLPVYLGEPLPPAAPKD